MQEYKKSRGGSPGHCSCKILDTALKPVGAKTSSPNINYDYGLYWQL